MAANPDAGGARYALRGVMRALLRAVVLSGLIAVGWLLGAGLSHADEDPGLPGTDLIHAINAGSSEAEEPSAGSVVHSTIARVLPAAATPRLAVQPTEKAGILRPIMQAVSSAKPLTDALAPIPQPLSGAVPHKAAVRSAVPAKKVIPVSPAAPTAVPAAVPAAAPSPVVTPVRHATPTVVPYSPAVTAVHALPAQPLVRNGPVDPAPASPPGGTSSPSVIGSTSGGASTKNAPDFTVHDSWATGSLAQPDGSLQRSGSDLPRSLSVKPSTSPD